MKSFLEAFTFGLSIFLIKAGYSKDEKYSANNYLKKKLLIAGILLLVLIIIAYTPDFYNGLVAGWKEAGK